MRFLLASTLVLAATACSSKSSNPDAPPIVDELPSLPDAPNPIIDGAPADAKNGFTLHMTNVFNWCDITVDGTKFTASVPPDTTYPNNTVVHLHADPTPNGTGGSNFIFGYWQGTDGHTGTDKDTNQDTTVTMTADKTVNVCCPFTNGTGC